MALVAAMAPKSNGSSTIGMKKSVVATIACVSLIRYTAASSDVSMPTRRSRGGMPGRDLPRISSRTPGAILQPQPPPWLNCVRRNGAGSGAFIAPPSARARITDGGQPEERVDGVLDPVEGARPRDVAVTGTVDEKQPFRRRRGGIQLFAHRRRDEPVVR